MKRRILCLISLVVCLGMLCSCDNTEASMDDLVGVTPLVAVAADSDERIAAEDYCIENDADLVEYNLTSDAVVAVLHDKADYVVLNEFEAQMYIDAGNEIAFVEKTKQKIDYVAWFNIDNPQLQAEFNSAFEHLKKDGVLTDIKDMNKSGKSYTYKNSAPVKGELVMLCDPLFDYILSYNDSGALCGVDYDIANAVCAYMGYELTIKTVEFDEMFNLLSLGEGDFIMSATKYTPERAEYFLASDVYSTLEYHVYTRG